MGKMIAGLGLFADVVGPWIAGGCMAYGFWGCATNYGLGWVHWPAGVLGFGVGFAAGKAAMLLLTPRASQRGR